MKTERMRKCKIIASKQDQGTVINTLYDLGLYHITPHIKGQYDLDLGEPLAKAEEISKLLVKIRRVLAAFDEKKPHNGKLLDSKTYGKAKKGVERIYTDFCKIDDRQKEISQELELLQEKLGVVKVLASFSVDPCTVRDSKLLCHFFGTFSEPDQLDAALKKYSFEVKDNYVFTVGKVEDKAELQEKLSQVGFSEIKIDESYTDLKKEKAKIQTKIKKLQDEEKQLKSNFAKIEKETQILTNLDYQLSEEIRKQELPLNFAATKSTVIAQGWIPKSKEQEVQKALNTNSKNKIHIEFTDPQKKEEPPIKFKHGKLTKPFEFLMDLYSLPKYKEFDPTALLFFTFPFFFGFMLGDLGYGLVLLIAFYLIKRKFPAAAKATNMLMFAAFVSMLFGLFYGEVFGFEHVSVETGKAWCDNLGICLERAVLEHHGVQQVVYDFPRMFDRVHSHMNIAGYEVLTVLVIGAIIGFIHLNFGLILGFFNELKSHGLWHAFTAKLSWIIIEIGVILAIMSGSLGISAWVGWGLAILGIILLGIGEGVQGIVELPALASQTLSYMRLGAVGLASIGLAVVVNENLAIPFLEKGGIFIAIGILIMLLGHGINILLGVIGPFLHGARLHYVEFFSKFFHGGGEEYKPFKKNTIGGAEK